MGEGNATIQSGGKFPVLGEWGAVWRLILTAL